MKKISDFIRSIGITELAKLRGKKQPSNRDKQALIKRANEIEDIANKKNMKVIVIDGTNTERN